MFDLRSTARRQLLAYFFTNPDTRLHGRDLAERLGMDHSNLAKELRRLEADGLFTSEISGRQKYFQLNPDYPLFEEVRSIVLKTAGATPLIARALGELQGIEQAWLYGSFARNQQDAASDIDVLIVGTPERTALAQATRKLEQQLGRQINYTAMSRKEFDQRRARKDAFLEDVWKHKRIDLTEDV